MFVLSSCCDFRWWRRSRGCSPEESVSTADAADDRNSPLIGPLYMTSGGTYTSSATSASSPISASPSSLGAGGSLGEGPSLVGGPGGGATGSSAAECRTPASPVAKALALERRWSLHRSSSSSPAQHTQPRAAAAASATSGGARGRCHSLGRRHLRCAELARAMFMKSRHICHESTDEERHRQVGRALAPCPRAGVPLGKHLGCEDLHKVLLHPVAVIVHGEPLVE